jgi:hypothetical protein
VSDDDDKLSRPGCSLVRPGSGLSLGSPFPASKLTILTTFAAGTAKTVVTPAIESIWGENNLIINQAYSLCCSALSLSQIKQ